MKKKTLAQVNGILGLVGGILLVLWPLTAALFSVVSSEGESIIVLFSILKVVILGFGIFGLVYYKKTSSVKSAGNILLIVGAGAALIPLLGWAGGIVVIVGGALNLTYLKNFKDKSTVDSTPEVDNNQKTD